MRDGGRGGCGGKWRVVGKTLGGVTFAKAHFTDEETKAQIGNTSLALPDLVVTWGYIYVKRQTCLFLLETLSAW